MKIVGGVKISTIPYIRKRVFELIEEAKEIDVLAQQFVNDLTVRQELHHKYQSWYRMAHTILQQNHFSGIEEFERAYGGQGNNFDYYITCYGRDPYNPEYIKHFKRPLEQQVALLASLPSELEARRYNYMKELSAQLSLSELDEAQLLIDSNFERAAGVVARVALEGFVKTLYQIHIGTHPIPKFDQCIIGLRKQGVIEERHRKHLADLYGLGSDCAHPGSTIIKTEIQRLINETRTVINTLP